MIWFILNGLITVGYVDKIEGVVATIEFSVENKLEYATVLINKSNCVPKEGQRVLFNRLEIISCLEDKDE